MPVVRWTQGRTRTTKSEAHAWGASMDSVSLPPRNVREQILYTWKVGFTIEINCFLWSDFFCMLALLLSSQCSLMTDEKKIRVLYWVSARDACSHVKSRPSSSPAVSCELLD